MTSDPLWWLIVLRNQFCRNSFTWAKNKKHSYKKINKKQKNKARTHTFRFKDLTMWDPSLCEWDSPCCCVRVWLDDTEACSWNVCVGGGWGWGILEEGILSLLWDGQGNGRLTKWTGRDLRNGLFFPSSDYNLRWRNAICSQARPRSWVDNVLSCVRLSLRGTFERTSRVVAYSVRYVGAHIGYALFTVIFL